MAISLTPCINTYNTNFKAQNGTNVLESSLKMIKEKPEAQDKYLSEKDKNEIQAQKVKSAIKRCIGVILLVDILYFTVKRSFKFAKLAKQQELKIKRSKLIPPRSAFDTPPKLD